jgi:multiple sugar transport system permease protein
MRQFFLTVPKELDEAARIDGASTFAVYWRIMLPLARPALATVAVFTFVDSWNDLLGPLIFINSQKLQTLPVALALFQGEFFTNTAGLMAAATITIVPVLLVFLLAQKHFVQGIGLTGLKD